MNLNATPNNLFHQNQACGKGSCEKYFGLSLVQIIIPIPVRMAGILSNCPMLNFIPASNATWSFFTNSIKNLAVYKAIRKTPNMNPSRTFIFFFR